MKKDTRTEKEEGKKTTTREEGRPRQKRRGAPKQPAVHEAHPQKAQKSLTRMIVECSVVDLSSGERRVEEENATITRKEWWSPRSRKREKKGETEREERERLMVLSKSTTATPNTRGSVVRDRAEPRRGEKDRRVQKNHDSPPHERKIKKRKCTKRRMKEVTASSEKLHDVMIKDRFDRGSKLEQAEIAEVKRSRPSELRQSCDERHEKMSGFPREREVSVVRNEV
ncbi:hypothetical protein ACROYT_G024394 [Oculina patagonica]